MLKHSLYELNEFIKRVVAINLPEQLWVSCEIMQSNRSRGHWYLELIEKDKSTQEITAQAQAVMWASVYYQLKRKIGKDIDTILQSGMQVLLQIKVDFNERYGLKYIIQNIDTAHTLGQMELKRRAILQQLQQERAFEKNKRLPLPTVIQKLAIISSEKAAGYKDFEQHLYQNPYGYQFQIHLYKAAMQGQFVEKEVIKALKSIHRSKDTYDAIVLTRGGGSKLDLSGFDNLKLCQAIANANLPVLTGIGHEIDESIADRVAHTALKTPTAVASFLIERMVEFESTLMFSLTSIKNQINEQLLKQSLSLQQTQQILSHKSDRFLNRQHQMLDYISEELPKLSRKLLTEQKRELEFLEKTNYLLSPEMALKRGFTITKVNGKAVSSVKKFNKGDKVTTVFKDGTVESEIVELKIR